MCTRWHGGARSCWHRTSQRTGFGWPVRAACRWKKNAGDPRTTDHPARARDGRGSDNRPEMDAQDDAHYQRGVGKDWAGGVAHPRGSLTSPSYLVRNRTLGPPLENNPEIPPSSRDEGLRLLHG